MPMRGPRGFGFRPRRRGMFGGMRPPPPPPFMRPRRRGCSGCGCLPLFALALPALGLLLFIL